MLAAGYEPGKGVKAAGRDSAKLDQATMVKMKVGGLPLAETCAAWRR
jgi:hypothetical protein